ncbi:MAG: GTP pyrophosphokinase family protein [Coprobacillus sp.]
MDGKVLQEIVNEDFLNMVQENMKPIQRVMSCYKCAIMEIETKFKVLDEQYSLEYDRNPIESIKSRLKSMDGIVLKMKRKNVPISLKSLEDNINDVAGVRVICSFPEDIYLLADCLLQQDDITLIERRDYIQNPKPSGYRSLHLIVQVPIFLENEKKPMKVEVQLRTIAMDFWASLEHKLRYKKNIPDEQIEQLSQELKECAQISADLDSRMEELKNRIARSSIEKG